MRLIGIACALLCSGAAAPAAPPKHVLAFYYGWYGNPEVSGRWVHWKDVDAAKRTIGGSTNFPALGAYDTHDPKVISGHCRAARAAGITGFIATWWGGKRFEDEGLKLLLDSAQREGLKVTIYYETVPPRGAPDPARAVADFEYLHENFASHPAWLKVEGRPVFFVYGRAVNEIKVDGWKPVIAEVNQRRPSLLIGDRISPEAAAVFDGIHTYNITGRTKGMTVQEIREWAARTFPEQVKTAGGKISCITVIPGYDDRKLDRPAPRPTTERHNGETYRVLWEQAIAAKPDWVLITSFNEWHEGSEIEASIENGDRELKTTAKYARRFRRR
ncbi:MAG: hypothetical protein HYS04_22545 [Acidobacteria bacterium]|nr:hypothetical protein [Acidobacteriota bacterium]